MFPSTIFAFCSWFFCHRLTLPSPGLLCRLMPHGIFQISIHVFLARYNIVFFFRVSSYYIVNSVCWSHALVNGPTSKRPSSDGGLCSGQLWMMWSAVCSGSPHSHAALCASPHFFIDAFRPANLENVFRGTFRVKKRDLAGKKRDGWQGPH